MPSLSISDAERQIMRLLWSRHPQSAEELIAALGPETGWKPGTIKTLINRLLNKQAIRAERDGRRFLYSPAISRRACVSQDSRRFLDRWFDGRLAPLVAHLSETEQLDKTEIEELKRLISTLSDEDGPQ